MMKNDEAPHVAETLATSALIVCTGIDDDVADDVSIDDPDYENRIAIGTLRSQSPDVKKFWCKHSCRPFARALADANRANRANLIRIRRRIGGRDAFKFADRSLAYAVPT